MTRGSILEYIAAAKARYWDASKKGKGKILDEFVSNTGYHRKSAIRLLGYRGRNKDVSKRGRPKKYHSVVLSELKYLWEIMDHLCSKRLKPFIPELRHRKPLRQSHAKRRSSGETQGAQSGNN